MIDLDVDDGISADTMIFGRIRNLYAYLDKKDFIM